MRKIRSLENDMFRCSLCFIFAILFGCATDSALRFHVDITAGEGVDPVVARKIVLSWLQQRLHQSGGARVEVTKVDYLTEEQCSKINLKQEMKEEICNAKYAIRTPWIKKVGYSIWYVNEVCDTNKCIYVVSDNDYGIDE